MNTGTVSPLLKYLHNFFAISASLLCICNQILCKNVITFGSLIRYFVKKETRKRCSKCLWFMHHILKKRSGQAHCIVGYAIIYTQ